MEGRDGRTEALKLRCTAVLPARGEEKTNDLITKLRLDVLLPNKIPAAAGILREVNMRVEKEWNGV